MFSAWFSCGYVDCRIRLASEMGVAVFNSSHFNRLVPTVLLLILKPYFLLKKSAMTWRMALGCISK